MSLGSRIRAARIEADLTQEELAAKCGVTKQAVSHWENDKSPPTAVHLRAIHEHCKNVDYNWLLEGPDDQPPPFGIARGVTESLTAAERAALKAYAEHLLAQRGQTG